MLDFLMLAIAFVFFALFPLTLILVPDGWMWVAFIVYGLREIGEPARKAMITMSLPEPIRPFTGTIQDAQHLSFLQGAGHGGSHPHLVHNWLLAILGERPALPDAATSANWTMVGICAHQSAMKDGEREQLPRF